MNIKDIATLTCARVDSRRFRIVLEYDEQFDDAITDWLMSLRVSALEAARFVSDVSAESFDEWGLVDEIVEGNDWEATENKWRAILVVSERFKELVLSKLIGTPIHT